MTFQDSSSHEFGSEFHPQEADHILSLFVDEHDFGVSAPTEVKKRPREEDAQESVKRSKVEISSNSSSIVKAAPTAVETAEPANKPPAPWFYYKDYSRQVDPSPETPLTLPGRIPSFPVKMLAILSRNDISGKSGLSQTKRTASPI